MEERSFAAAHPMQKPDTFGGRARLEFSSLGFLEGEGYQDTVSNVSLYLLNDQ